MSTAEVVEIPTGARIVLFSANGDFYAKFGTSSGVTTAVPAADVTDGSAGELNPGGRLIPADATHIAIVAPAAAVITFAFYEA